jgi:A/G-specific adenine glycosylase
MIEAQNLETAIEDFRRAVLDHYREKGRSFPWRETRDPWAILVSEVMLQQTQTDRVVPYWLRWLDLWPDPASLAVAPLDSVLREWSGLGYNRRGRFLKEAAGEIVSRFGGMVPSDPASLETLPGIGPYTARAIACFAFASAEPFVETNIRAAVIHFFFPERESVKDAELVPILEKAVDVSDPRRWYWALMDYGAALKKVAPNPNRRSAHYVRQSRFEGSLRQARGAILKSITSDGAADIYQLAEKTGLSPDRLSSALDSLSRDSLVAEHGGLYSIP